MDTLRKSTFLIVENDPNDAFLVRRALQASPNCGASFICRNSSEAQAYLRGAGMYADRAKFPMPDVIVTDLRMGPETGIQLLEWIRQQDAPFKDTKVVILTGSASPEQYQAAKLAGAERVYRKPSKMEELQTLLGTIASELGPSNPPKP